MCGEALAARLACGDAEKAQENVGEAKRIKAASAGSSYYSESNVKYAEISRRTFSLNLSL